MCTTHLSQYPCGHLAVWVTEKHRSRKECDHTKFVRHPANEPLPSPPLLPACPQCNYRRAPDIDMSELRGRKLRVERSDLAKIPEEHENGAEDLDASPSASLMAECDSEDEKVDKDGDVMMAEGEHDLFVGQDTTEREVKVLAEDVTMSKKKDVEEPLEFIKNYIEREDSPVEYMIEHGPVCKPKEAIDAGWEDLEKSESFEMDDNGSGFVGGVSLLGVAGEAIKKVFGGAR